MKSLRASVIGSAMLVGALAFATIASGQGPNHCLAGKNKCASKKMQAKLKCHSKAEKDGVAVDPVCLQKATDKFDGGTKGFAGSCFGKLEAKNDGPCLTTGDLAAMENKVDAFVTDVVQELDPGFPAPIQNDCSAGKKKCVYKKAAALLKCHEKAVKAGSPPLADQGCLDKARGKFGGFCDAGPNAGMVCDEDSDCPTSTCEKGCFTKLEDNGGCLTSNDAPALEAKADAFVQDVLCELGYTTLDCTTPTPTLTATPTPTVTATPGPGPCGNSIINVGEDCDPPGTQCPNAATGIMCDASCQCACPGTLEFTATDTRGVLDSGWAGFGHDETLVSDGTFTVDVTSCAGSSRPCGVCNFTGPIANAGAANYGASTGTQINNHRCTGDVRKTCGPGGEDPTCTTSGGTCEFYFDSLVPTTSGGISWCFEYRFNGSFSGTFNAETGSTSSAPLLATRVFQGALQANPCPRCLSDPTPNDGKRQGTCSGGLDNGLGCDENGRAPNAHFGSTSLDCRPSTVVVAASLPVRLTNSTTGTETRTLSAANPNCRATGHTAEKCFCDTCNNLLATPCNSNADCPDPPGPIGPICSGLRCTGGTNAGAACTVASECPGGGGACGRPGFATQPNSCDDQICTPTTGNEGECAGGPTDFFCAPNATMIGCVSQMDCDAAGLRSCNGGANVNQVCTTDAQCPGGTNCAVANPGDTGHPGGCCLDRCTGAKTRECFTDNGIVGNSINATGAASVPVNDASDPTLASLFCVGPSSSAFLNAEGRPGPARLESMFHVQGTP